MRCFTTKPNVIKPSTTSIGLVVTFTRLMPLTQLLARLILFLPFQKELTTKVSWQKCWPLPAQSELGDGTSTTRMTLHELQMRMIENKNVVSFDMRSDLWLKEDPPGASHYKATQQHISHNRYFNGKRWGFPKVWTSFIWVQETNSRCWMPVAKNLFNRLVFSTNGQNSVRHLSNVKESLTIKNTFWYVSHFT